ncbi:MAG: ribonuclease HI [Chlorobi bacterium]|nr:ribonuclease HI [Chlorobiota bacterium]
MKEIIIYTDGSCHTQLKVGAWASIILIEGDEILLKDYELDTTHNRMELLAVIKAFEFIEKEKFEYDSIVLKSDSQYVVEIERRMQKLKENNFITKKGTEIQNVDLVKKLISYIEKFPVKFIKVKAHQKKTSERNINIEVDKISRKIVRTYILNCSNNSEYR